MKEVLLSIQPVWCELIARGQKTLEVRKSKPKLEPPFKCYIYMTTGNASIPNGKGMVHHSGGRCVIGEFVCDKIVPIKVFPNGTIQDYMFYNIEQSFVAYDDIVNYIGKDRTGYGWHIFDLKIYDKPMGISEFHQCHTCCYMGVCTNGCWNPMRRPPQSWCYVEEVRA